MTHMLRVGDVAEQIRGVSYDKNEASSTPRPGYLPILRAGNISDSGLVFDDLVFVPEHRIAERQKIRRNDVVIAASSGSLEVVGKAARAIEDFDGSFGAFCKVLRPGPDVDPSYFAHFFRTPEYRRRVSTLAAGVNINNLRNEHLDDLLMPIPPLPEQRRIAAILDKADALRAKRRAALEKLDELAQAVFLDMFGDPVTNPKGWPWYRLGDVADFFAGSTLPIGVDYRGQEGGYFLLKVSDMNLPGNEVYLKSCHQWSGAPGAASCTCPAGSIVFPKRGGAISTNKKRITTRPAVLDPNLMAITPRNGRVTLHYLYSWSLRLDLTSISSGSSVPQLNKRDLSPLRIAVPPMRFQEEYSRRVEYLQRIIAVQRTALRKMEHLFSSLQYRAFFGEL